MSESITVREARHRYFAENGFAPDGGYNDPWVFLTFGGLKLPLYNSRARRRAVALHDLHHIATGFGTHPQGEAQIGIWELAAGTHDKWFAFFINIPALIYGYLLWPKVSQAAWRLGRTSRTLYQQEFDETLLDLTVEELRERTLGENGVNHPEDG